MVIFYKKWKKYNETQLTKNKMELNIRKMTNHPPSPVNVKLLSWLVTRIKLELFQLETKYEFSIALEHEELPV